jgi:predicted AAA+ superfamily ATPase
MEGILEILKRWNPWEKEIDKGIRREMYIRKIMPYFERKEVIVLKGVRRSGKSTIIRQLISELIAKGIDKKQILYLYLEDYGFANNLKIELLDEVLETYKKYSNNKGKTFFFIDEAQKIPSWEKWVRTKYDLDENIKFVISGSSASLLSKELSTLLTGRNLSFRIMPLSFNEFVQFTKTENVEGYMKYGGFPEVVLEKSEEKKTYILQQYFEDIIHKDIIDRHNIRNTKQIMDLARYLVSTSGSKVSINKLSKIFGTAKDTLQTYVNYMIDAYLLLEVNYFSYSAKVRHDVTKLPKLYCLDPGFINTTNLKYSKNTGQMFENAVLIKLTEKHGEISYWGEMKSEVDFIVGRTALNVTATNRIAEREFAGLEDFNKKHGGFSLIVISKSLKKDNILPLIEFLKQETP